MKTEQKQGTTTKVSFFSKALKSFLILERVQEWVNCPLPPLEDPSVILTSPQFPKKVQEDIKSKQYKNTLQQKAVFCPNFRLTKKN